MRAFKGAPATLTTEVGPGGADSLADRQRPEEPRLGAAPPWASVRHQFYGLFMRAGVPLPRPGTSNAAAPTLTPAARRPCVLPPYSQSRPGFLTRSSTPHSPQAAPPAEKETRWGGLPPGIMTQLQKGGGVTPGQSPQHTPHAREAVWGPGREGG